jgi:antagonist of KipI
VVNVVQLEVLNPGALSTIQDLGRFGYAHLGISPAGAADGLSFRIANRIVGNEENTPAIEMNLVGATLRFAAACTIAVTGAEIAGVPMYEQLQIASGDSLECGPIRKGARTYLAIACGIKVPKVLGSASTHLAARFGGFQGRALKRGDILEISNGTPTSQVRNAARLREISQPSKEIRVVNSSNRELFHAEAFERLCSSEYVVLEQSNRLGIRLSGAAIPASSPTNLLTHGVTLGTIQIPPEGQPIILFVDQQTTGGYPVLANVIAADMHSVGQLLPRDHVRFKGVSIEGAITALREQERRLADAFGE